MRQQAPVLAYFVAAALLHPLLCQGTKAASSPAMVTDNGNLAADGMALDQRIDHFLVLAAVFVMCLFR
ncbi:hypothetical protein QOZ80_1AG0031250 [Eleusine coracana subsp. coracana]|nr:hypothetical protein QOZ80_1AG0031250 [Eleusine coracana subsp. coracana]